MDQVKFVEDSLKLKGYCLLKQTVFHKFYLVHS